MSFTEKELITLKDCNFFTVKSTITHKIIDIFLEISEDLNEELKFKSLPNSILNNGSKVSRGENYKGLPYIVLDYPRLFKKDEIFAFRTIFWWGKYFSNAFLIKGDQLEVYKDQLIANKGSLKKKGIYFDVSKQPWNHDLRSEAYVPIDHLNDAEFDQLIGKRTFIKLAALLELEKSHELKGFTRKNFKLFLKCVGI